MKTVLILAMAMVLTACASIAPVGVNAEGSLIMTKYQVLRTSATCGQPSLPVELSMLKKVSIDMVETTKSTQFVNDTTVINKNLQEMKQDGSVEYCKMKLKIASDELTAIINAAGALRK